MFKPVDSDVSFPRLERDVLAFWKEHDIFRRSVEDRAGGPRYVFYEGPPTANGRPGIHHVLARVFKDLVPRYWTMKGYQVERKGGWDTHGLPVELEVERELGLSSKSQIEAYGIAEFNQKCRDSVFRYVQAWEEMTDRIGFWVDMDAPYVTYHNTYIESGWWILKQLWDRNLIFQDYKVTPHCPRCGTSLSSHELALGYRDDTDDPSIDVSFKLQPPPAGHELAEAGEAAFLVWTTTPWTLPGNVALAVNPDASYALVENVRAEGEEPRRFILAAHLIESALTGETRILKLFLGSHLIGLTYEPLFQFLPLDKPAHRVVGGDFVSLEDGTGIVHLAPAFGEIDLQVGRAEDLPILITVDPRGNVIDVPAPFAGMFVKDADPLIVRDLTERGRIYRSGRIKHTYPFCWRCETPLLYYAKTSWYIRTTAVKERLITANEEINWYPDHIKAGRFGDWLKNNVDWAISRERYWGTPLPFWRCDGCGRWEAIGGLDELAARTGRPELRTELDLHRPSVDDVTWSCAACSGTFRRTPEVMDCWFDSGAMPVAQWHYPFENPATFQTHFPADFICEAIDQTRGWFYSLHALSVLLFDQPCYRNVICLGHILDAKGEKMSKSRGNVVEPMAVLDKHGADAVRWYLYTTSPPGNQRRFSADLVGEVVRKFLLTLWNTYSFFVIYANIDGFDPRTTPAPADRSELDRWIRSELHALIREVRERLDNYDPTGAGRAIQAFVDDLSNWYVRRGRRRFWKSENDSDKWAAYHTLYECLSTLAYLLAPFTPFLAEDLYQNLVRSVDSEAPASVHLALFPAADESRIDEDLMAATAVVQRVVSLGRAARSKASLRVRQPLGEVVVKLRSAAERPGLERFADQILEELNVKRLTFADDEGEVVDYVIKPNLPVVGPKYGRQVGAITAALRSANPVAVASAARAGQKVAVDAIELEPGEVLIEVTGRPGYAAAADAGYVVALSTEVTPELAREGLVREVVHRIQTLRKDAKFEIADRIQTYLVADADLRAAIEAHAAYVRGETLSEALIWEAPPAGVDRVAFSIDGRELACGVARRE